MDSYTFNGYGGNFRNRNWLWNVPTCMLCRSKTVHYRKNICNGICDALCIDEPGRISSGYYSTPRKRKNGLWNNRRFLGVCCFNGGRYRSNCINIDKKGDQGF